MSERLRARSPISPGEVVGGKYRVERVLGAGGMGVVVAATHLDLGQSVALKFILPEALTGPGAVERFMREARAAVRLKSEHVARVYDVGRDGQDRPYMVLELLEGMDLARLNKQKGPLPVADSVEYVLQACEALVEAHAAGIVHRDLKPQNLFVTRRLNGAPLVKVLDFGIAKAIGPAAAGQMALTDSSVVIGSPLYMAPEQMRSARVADVRSDIWSLGVILYELVGGQLPFDGETVTELCIRVVNEPPKALAALRPGIDSNLAEIVMRCIAKDPNARFQNVAQLASSLEPFSRSAIQGGPVRPWRSFEDTQDSQERPPATADDTGPSTIVTMPAISAVPSAAAPALTSEPTPAGASSMRVDSREKLASTDVAWGQGSAGASPDKPRPRSFAKGLAAGVVVSIASAAVAAAVLLRDKAPPPAPLTASPPPSAILSVGPVESTPIPAPVDAPAVASAPAASSGLAVSALPSAPVRAVRGPARGTARPDRTEPARASAASPAAAPPRPETEPPPPAPNGAPILR